MKILAIGRPLMLYRLLVRIDDPGVSVVGCSNVADAAGMLLKEPFDFDMVIIDNQLQDAGAVCRNVLDIAVAPIALMLKEKDVDWKELRHLEVDGYLPDDAGSAELMARIRAYSRRFIH